MEEAGTGMVPLSLRRISYFEFILQAVNRQIEGDISSFSTTREADEPFSLRERCMLSHSPYPAATHNIIPLALGV